MFTIQQIEEAHQKVKSGADFPNYIQEIKRIGVKLFETWVQDSHTVYYGEQGFEATSAAQYDPLNIQEKYVSTDFETSLKKHQQGETDYFTFCRDCARSGVEKWVMNLEEMTCVYYDKSQSAVLLEHIPE
ncbi:DUF1398 domain-containing protein [Sphingobacterium sp. LRF_L2]|uniref:DUF1398 domain-containing protein n=1 Tax=Sphingobacterium sp. LRF_L2 TaxID=3369421 RepID=UPI003F5E2423